MPGHDIIVIGASAGGVETLMQLIHALPANLPASVFIVLHIPAYSTSMLPQILSRAGVLPVLQPVDYQKIEARHIYVAPPDHHLLIEQGYMRVVRGPRENRHRPAIDPSFVPLPSPTVHRSSESYSPERLTMVRLGSWPSNNAAESL